MSDQLILDDGALSEAVSHFEVAATRVTRAMRAPLGEVNGLTELNHRFNEFLCGVSTARRVLGDAALVGKHAAAEWIVDSGELDADLNSALGRAALVRG